ncbi:MAG: oligoribonuclease [Candidatus Paceibacteria bacterium]
MQRADLMVWMDLEMTSLVDAQVDQIIEIAVILTDTDLNIVAEGPDLIIHADPHLFEAAPASARELHEKNGLIPLVAASTISLAEAEQQVFVFLEEHVVPQSAPLCGNSIHMDRHFLRMQMPRVESYLFYRCIDVSSLKELARRWAPEIFEAVKELKGESAHRAKDDIRASIAELRLYRERFLKI